MDVIVDTREVEKALDYYGHLDRELDWSAVGDEAVDAVKDNFDGGQGWPPKKDGYPSNLVDTGDLRDSVSYEVQKDGVEIEHGLEYGVYHVLGTRHMPVRDYMELSPRAEDKIVDTLLENLPD